MTITSRDIARARELLSDGAFLSQIDRQVETSISRLQDEWIRENAVVQSYVFSRILDDVLGRFGAVIFNEDEELEGFIGSLVKPSAATMRMLLDLVEKSEAHADSAG